jgi:ubiquinone/menaquinone biosynthesis C-methylase UbiE
MGLYSDVIFPYLCDRALGTPFVARHRHELLRHAAGHVLEIGFGTGLNLPYYGDAVGRITTVDPSEGMLRRARERIRQSNRTIEQRVLQGEQMPFDAGTFDCVVTTFTLCSVQSPSQVMSELFRVLRTGGSLLFLEHGLSPEPAVQKWQRRLNWLQVRLGAGCHLDRDIRELIATERFSTLEVTEFYLERVPRTHGYVYRGIATK